MELLIVIEQSKEEGKGQESIQSNSTHDPVWEGDIHKKKFTYMGAERSALAQ